MPPSPMTWPSDSMSAATAPDVRRGDWIRLSAASAPSTGRSHFSTGFNARENHRATVGTSINAARMMSV